MLNVLLSSLIRAVAYTFNEDATRPGVIISSLRDGSVYASVVRYGKGEGFKNGKLVVCKVNMSDVNSALTLLSEEFLKVTRPKLNPIDELRSILCTTKE